MPSFTPLPMSLYTLFNIATCRHLVIPDFQRPYAWKREHCEDLWTDLMDFSPNDDGNSHDGFFLGPIVVYKENNELNIIDGQQRITTLSLLLHAILRCINYLIPTIQANDRIIPKLRNAEDEIMRMLWRPVGDFDVDFNDPRVERRNVTPNDQDIFRDILGKGNISLPIPPNHSKTPGQGVFPLVTQNDLNATENNSFCTPDNSYFHHDKFIGFDNQLGDTALALSKLGTRGNNIILRKDPIKRMFESNECINYCHFLDHCYRLSPIEVLRLFTKLKDNSQLLILESNNSNDSWDIFDIINNRGMQLSDSDIFKNTIAQNLNRNNINNFREQWNQLDSSVKGLSYLIKDDNTKFDIVFRHYMQAFRMSHDVQENEIQKSKDFKLRRFYTTGRGQALLQENDIITQLKDMTDFLASCFDTSFGDSRISDQAKQDISVLNAYQKQGKWSYLLSTFWYCYHSLDDNDFSRRFEKFIRYCTAALILKSLVGKKSAADIPYLCETIASRAASDKTISSFTPAFQNQEISNFIQQFINPNTDGDASENSVRANISGDTRDYDFLLTLYVYCFDRTQPIISVDKSVEHILPQEHSESYSYWHDFWSHLATKNEYDNRESKFIDEYTEHLGNKILLASGANKAAGKNKFETKISVYKNTAKEPNPTLELQAFIRAHGSRLQWSKQDVDDRTETMVNAIIQYLKDALNGGIA